MAVAVGLLACLWAVPAVSASGMNRPQAASYNADMTGLVGGRLRPTHLDSQSLTVTGKDYVFPSEALGGVVVPEPSRLQSAAGKPSKTQATVHYRAIDGSYYDLVEHRGRYVAVLLPVVAPEGVYFTADHVEELVEQLDLLYVQYAEVVGGEPKGQGLVTVAFVPHTCGAGCGLVGSRGIEFQSYEGIYKPIIKGLDAGYLSSVLMHEMAHNFDTLGNLLHYLPDHPHAWTDLFEYFAPYRYGRMASSNQAADELFDSPLRSVWKDYVSDPAANWSDCVANGACADLPANQLWAMVYYRIEAVYGRTALLNSFAFLTDYARTHNPPASVAGKESLRILSLGVGAGANISCVMDQLNWPLTDSVRNDLQARFGNGNALCADADGDGFSAFTGDCDDTRATSHLLAAEIPGNGRDDDCDERVDEMSLAESGSSDDFHGTIAVGMPVEVLGSSADLDDFDTFAFPLPPSARARVTMCAHDGFNGWVMALQPDGSALAEQNWFTYRSGAGCSSNTFDFAGLAKGTLSVTANESAGGYEFTVSPGAPLPREASGAFSVMARAGGGMTVRIDDADGIFSTLGADAVELSIVSAGWQVTRPFTPGMNFELNAQSAAALQDGAEYQLRVRPLSNGLPLATFSAGQRFRYDRVGRSLPTVDDSLSGAWFDPEHDGEGFIVEGLGNGRALVYWFTYDDQGQQRWMLGTGTVEGNRLQVSSLLDTHGARFGQAFRPGDVAFQSVGHLSITFLDCSSAYLNYSVDNVGGNQTVKRLSHVYGHGCDQPSTPPDTDLSGSWFDPERDGEGFIVQQVDAQQALVFWFTYDDTGKQSWVFNTGTIANGRITVPDLLQASGGHFGRSFRPDEVSYESWGELELDLTCSGGTARWSSTRTQDKTGTFNLVPLTRLQNSGCL